MESVFTTGLGPILVLWIGALVFYVLDQLFEPQDRGIAEIVVLILALGFAFNARTQIGFPVPFGQPLASLNWPGLAPYLVIERDSWLLSLFVLVLAAAMSLTSLGKPTHGRSGRLALLGAVLLYLAAGDWVTLAAAWGLVDLALTPAGMDGRPRLARPGAGHHCACLVAGQRRDGVGQPCKCAADRGALSPASGRACGNPVGDRRPAALDAPSSTIMVSRADG